VHSYNKFSAVLLAAFLAFFACLGLLLPDDTFSAAERRQLAEKPVLSRANLVSGRFGEAAEKYLADHFPLRELWLRLKTAVEKACGKKEQHDVYFGRDGYLLQKANGADTEILAANLAALNEFARATEAECYFLLAPVSMQVYADKLPPYAPNELEGLPAAVKKGLAREVTLIDPLPLFLAKKGEGLFYRTDHHWTTRGAYYAYVAAGEALGYQGLAPSAFRKEVAATGFYGTLAARSGRRDVAPDRIELWLPATAPKVEVEYVQAGKVADGFYALDRLETFDQYAVFLDGDHPQVIIRTDGVPGRRLLVVKDSFANSLLPFLALHFAEIHVLDLRYYHRPVSAYLQENKIAEVLFLYNSLTVTGERVLQKLS
jgi:hypothetical protein